MSSFQVPVKRIRAIEAHPNADAIEFAVVDGYRSIVRKGDFASGELVAYIPEASSVPEAVIRRLGLWDAEKGKGKLSGKAGNRVSAIKLRGQISQGLCYPLISVGDMWLIDLPTDGDEPEDMADAFVLNEGDDVASLRHHQVGAGDSRFDGGRGLECGAGTDDLVRHREHQELPRHPDPR